MIPSLSREGVTKLWLHRQGLARPRGSRQLDRPAFIAHLERTGALQLDSVNAVDRAHYLTLWSRFGPYDRAEVDGWVYEDRVAYEYWGHEASILPISHLPLGRRRMRRFPTTAWSGRSWWDKFSTSTASKRRVLKRLREEGPLESADFERRADEVGPDGPPGGSIPLPAEDKRTLKLLWHDGRAAVAHRTHFRCAYDIAERVYPASGVASTTELEDSWLLTGLSGCGVAGQRHLINYVTGPRLDAARRRRVIGRNLKRGTVVEVRVEGIPEPCYALPGQWEGIADLDPPSGTTLVCPFDSLLWQRKRAEDLMDFEYRIEIYTPKRKRQYGYYAMPILHEGRLVGRLDPKLHRDRATLEIRSVHFERDVAPDAALKAGLREAVHSLAEFCGADRIDAPSDRRDLA